MNTKLIALAICAVGIALDSVPVAAEERMQVSFQVRCTFGKPSELKIGDVEGHSIAVVENKCVNKSIGKLDFLDQGEGTLQAMRDYVKGTGSNQGYMTLSKGGDTVIMRFTGTTVTTPTAEGSETRFSGDWVFVSGTGQYQSIKSGSGIWSGRRVSATELETALVGTLAR